MSNFCYKFAKILCKTPSVRLYSSPGFKSAICLENLYPESSLKLTTPSKHPNDPQSKFNGYIPVEDLDITYSRSTGPGGQNVNKVNTKVEVRFHVNNARWISDDIKLKLSEKFCPGTYSPMTLCQLTMSLGTKHFKDENMYSRWTGKTSGTKLKNKITKDGFIIFRSDLTRSQQLNLADCLEKIRASVRSCIVEENQPSEETQEKIRRRHERASRERLALKRQRSSVKNDRQSPPVNL